MGYLVNLCRRAAPAALLLVAAGSAHASSPPEPVGWVETARIFPGDMRIMAKLDTGALSSSINAHDITEFERNGRRWVRFTVVNRAGDRQTMELPLVRNVLIKEHGGEKDQRPVVKMGICIGGHYAETQVSLVDRSGFLYPLLVGRRYLRGAFLVDASRKHTTEPRCERGSADE
jgi:hypothetical protein